MGMGADVKVEFRRLAWQAIGALLALLVFVAGALFVAVGAA
jgi:hypothetical protein